jgi:hypothetical protein
VRLLVGTSLRDEAGEKTGIHRIERVLNEIARRPEEVRPDHALIAAGTASRGLGAPAWPAGTSQGIAGWSDPFPQIPGRRKDLYLLPLQQPHDDVRCLGSLLSLDMENHENPLKRWRTLTCRITAWSRN